MAKFMMRAGKVAGSTEVKGRTAKIDEERDTAPRETDGTQVNAGVSLTLSENFQAVKVEVGVTLPTTFAMKEAAMKEAWTFVDRELAGKLKSAKKLMSSL